MTVSKDRADTLTPWRQKCNELHHAVCCFFSVSARVCICLCIYAHNSHVYSHTRVHMYACVYAWMYVHQCTRRREIDVLLMNVHILCCKYIQCIAFFLVYIIQHANERVSIQMCWQQLSVFNNNNFILCFSVARTSFCSLCKGNSSVLCRSNVCFFFVCTFIWWIK